MAAEPMRRLLERLLCEDSGADIIEYALLAAFIGVCAVAAWISIPPKIAAAYTNWDTSIQNLSSCTPDPGGGTVGC